MENDDFVKGYTPQPLSRESDDDALARSPIAPTWQSLSFVLRKSPWRAITMLTRYIASTVRVWRYRREEAKPGQRKRRFLYFKLPLKPVDYHWVFSDKTDFLKGRLSLSLKGPTETHDILVFQDGKISPGWHEIKGKDKRPKNEMYFGFCSDSKYPVSTQYQGEIKYETSIDLPGIGPSIKGYLPAGVYSSTGELEIYSTEDDTAFLLHDHYHPFWPLTVTENKGWLSK